MAQTQKIELQVEIKSSAESVFQVFRSKLYLLPKMAPGIVKDIKLVKGDWESVGSIREWSYVAGDSETALQVTEAIDNENKTIAWRAYGGNVDKYFNNITSKIQVTESLVKWTMGFENKNENIPPPAEYLDVVSVIVKSVDNYLSKNA